VPEAARPSDGKLALTGSGDHLVRLWDLASATEIRRHASHQDLVSCVRYSEDDQYVYSASHDEHVCMWRREGGEPLHRMHVGEAAVLNVVPLGDTGQVVVDAFRDVCLLDLPRGLVTRRLVGHTDLVMTVTVAPDGRTVVSGAADRTIRIWDSVSGQEMRCRTGHADRVMSVAFSPCREYLLSGGGTRPQPDEYVEGTDFSLRL
jgi:WD40 repeat protein